MTSHLTYLILFRAQQVSLDLLEELAHLVQRYVAWTTEVHNYKSEMKKTQNKPLRICFLRVLLVSQVHLVFLEKRVHLVFVETMDPQDGREREAPLGLLEALETKEILEKMDHR